MRGNKCSHLETRRRPFVANIFKTIRTPQRKGQKPPRATLFRQDASVKTFGNLLAPVLLVYSKCDFGLVNPFLCGASFTGRTGASSEFHRTQLQQLLPWLIQKLKTYSNLSLREGSSPGAKSSKSHTRTDVYADTNTNTCYGLDLKILYIVFFSSSIPLCSSTYVTFDVAFRESFFRSQLDTGVPFGPPGRQEWPLWTPKSQRQWRHGEKTTHLGISHGSNGQGANRLLDLLVRILDLS